MTAPKPKLLDRGILVMMAIYAALFFGSLVVAAGGWQIFKLMVKAAGE